MTASLLTQITLYSKPGCPGCMATKRALDKSGADYRIIDITQDPSAADEVRELGYAALPVVVYGQENWTGFRPDRLTATVQSQQQRLLGNAA